MKDKKKNDNAEEVFLTLLQRIQRQYHPNNNNNDNNTIFFLERPPDEAAAALGKQLGVSFASLAVDNGIIPKNIQEKALVGLANAKISPSVVVSFLSTVLQKNRMSSSHNNTSTTSSRLNMDWLATWILHTESLCCEEEGDAAGNNNIPTNGMGGEMMCLDALTAMIRAYAVYLYQTTTTPMVDTTTTTTTTSMGNPRKSSGSNDHPLATTYARLQSSAARICMIREFTKVAYQENNIRQLRIFLSPFMAACPLALPTPTHEALLFLEGIWRESWSAMEKTQQFDNKDNKNSYLMDMVLWLTQSLNVFLWGIPCRPTFQDKLACKELAHRWYEQVLQMGSFLAEDCFGPETTPSSFSNTLERWLIDLVVGTLPRLFAILPNYRISLEPLLLQIQGILWQSSSPNNNNNNNDSSNSLCFALDPVETLRLATLVLCNPLKEDVRELLQILRMSVPNNTSRAIHTILLGLTSMFLRDPICSSGSTELLHALRASSFNNPKKKKKTSSNQTNTKSSSSTSRRSITSNIIQFFDESFVPVDNFVHFLSSPENSFQNSRFSAAQQAGALLLGIGWMEAGDENHPQKHQQTAHAYLKKLLEYYPHLGISLLPVLVDSINAACIRGDGTSMLQQLDFLCDAVVQDTQCAREIWNLLGVELMNSATIPSVIRASMIRLFPKICVANKRLYKRVIESLGANLAAQQQQSQMTQDHENLEIRLAVVATIADLAKEDRIRDVTDVIGWIQGFIVDGGWIRSKSTLDQQTSRGNAALVHYAILCLHYLVVAQELDYNLVMVVLNKRLCSIHDMSQVLRLPPLVLENFALLLGDGECEDMSDNDDPKQQQVGVSVHVTRSVNTLVNMARATQLDPKAGTTKEDRGTLLRCRGNILESLAKYSMEALGVDDEGIQAVTSAAVYDDEDNARALPASGVRYSSLRQVVEDGIALLESGPLDDSDQTAMPGIEMGLEGYSEDEMVDADISSPLVSLTSKLLKYEEGILGSTLWQKRGKPKKEAKQTTQRKTKKIVPLQFPVDQSQREALPSTTSVQKFYNDDRNTATSLAVLLCFEGKPMSLFTDLAADITNESSDPLLRAFTVQAWLNAARNMLAELVATLSSSEVFEQMLLEIREWRFRLDAPDNLFLALSALALYIPDILGPFGDHSPYIIEICDEIWQAYKNRQFENSDIGKLCLGFIGVCAIRNRSMELLDEIVEALIKSVTGYGGQASFGAYYGLGCIAQSCPALFEEDESGKQVGDLGFTGRIVGFLVNELVPCITGQHDAIISLVACIKNGSIAPEIIDSLTLLGKKKIKIVKSKVETAKSLFISFALALPALTCVNDELLLGAYCLLESLPWGCGKGLGLSSVLHACRQSGLFENREIEKIYSKYAKVFEEGMDTGVEGLDDIFYAVTATMTKVIPYSIRRFLVGNRTLFDEDGRAVSLLAAVVSLSSLPCLGCGAMSFTDTPQLSQLASREDISGVVTLISEGTASREWSKYPQVAILLMGFLASMNTATEMSDASVSSRGNKSSPYGIVGSDDTKHSQLPTALPGTVLEVLMSVLSERFYNPSLDMNEKTNSVIVKLLGCMEVISLPGHFAEFLEQMLRAGNDMMKAACAKLLVSQIHGRPRAVFDGREYVDLALRISKMPVTTLRVILGQGDAPKIFLESFGDIVPKFSSEHVEEAIENVWRLCIHQVGHCPGWTVSYLSATKKVLKSGVDKKSFCVSPKTTNIIRMFLLRRAFSGIRDASWTTTTSSAASDELSIVEMYANCLMEMPLTALIDAEFFVLKDLDGFVGEALRNRCVMILVRQGYFATQSRASSEIASALAWFSRQLVSSEDEIFSSTLLQVACSIAEASSGENSDRKRELLLSLLDNLLMAGSFAAYVGLQMLGALVGQWCKGLGSDGDLSLACLCAAGMERWQVLSPPTLQQTFRMLVHDLPFNLAAYARQEKLSGVVFNRLWRLYNKWWEQGADQETIDCVRKALICCRSVESGGTDFVSLASSMLL